MFQRTAVEKDPEVEVATMLFLYCDHGPVHRQLNLL